MSDSKSSSKFGLGLIIGAVAAGLAALFLTPSTGEENREKVARKIKELEKLLHDKDREEKLKFIFGEVTHDTVNLYNTIKKEMIQKLAVLKKEVKDIDKEQFKVVVSDVLGLFKKQFKHEAKSWEKLGGELVKEWGKLQTKKKK